MKCQILFSGKNKKNISKCRLLKILPRVLSVKDGHSATNILQVSERGNTSIKSSKLVNKPNPCENKYDEQ